MIWQSLTILGALVWSSQGQVTYAPYRGPPVVPVVLPGGFIADTKEVAAAKQYFLNALAKTAAEVKDEIPREDYNTRYYQSSYQPQQSSYQVETPRYLSQAQQFYQPQAQQSYQPQAQRYNQPQIYQPTYQPTYQAVTPSYQVESQQSYQQVQSQQYSQPQAYKAPAALPTQPSYQPIPVYQREQNYDDGDYRADQYSSTYKRPDPSVVPVILDNGYIADTQEVNAAKEEHFAAVAKAQELTARAAERAAKLKASAGYFTGYQASGLLGPI